MRVFWLGPYLVGLTFYDVFWQYMPYTEHEKRFWTLTLPWCWLSRTWRDMRQSERAWTKVVKEESKA